MNAARDLPGPAQAAILEASWATVKHALTSADVETFSGALASFADGQAFLAAMTVDIARSKIGDAAAALLIAVRHSGLPTGYRVNVGWEYEGDDPSTGGWAWRIIPPTPVGRRATAAATTEGKTAAATTEGKPAEWAPRGMLRDILEIAQAEPGLKDAAMKARLAATGRYAENVSYSAPKLADASHGTLEYSKDRGYRITSVGAAFLLPPAAAANGDASAPQDTTEPTADAATEPTSTEPTADGAAS